MLIDQLKKRARQWEVTVTETWETSGALFAFGVRYNTDVRYGTDVGHGRDDSYRADVVLKISRQQGDEWKSGEVLRAFDGHGTVRVLEYDAGAILVERLDPGGQLVELVRRGEDEEATEMLAEVMQQMAGCAAPPQCPTVLDWRRGFQRYLSSGDKQVPLDLVTEADDWFRKLAATSGKSMLLHGDLHHYNVLYDSKRGWVAIDPKGVVGEAEYEVGAVLRNPIELPELFASKATVETRLKILSKRLSLDYERALAWGFAQAVLSAIWDVEDGYKVPPEHHALKLAQTIRPLLR